jgi:hypothetical protein
MSWLVGVVIGRVAGGDVEPWGLPGRVCTSSPSVLAHMTASCFHPYL